MHEAWPGVTCYIVGLGSDYRGQPLETQLSARGFSWEHVWGFDGRRMSPEALSEYVDQSAAVVLEHRPLTAGEVGCALSHREALRRIVDRGDKWSLVFEDDVRISPLLTISALSTLLSVTPAKQPTIILFSCREDYTVGNRRSLIRLPLEGQKVSLLRARVPPVGAQAYLINSAAAAIALSRSVGPITSVADWPSEWSYRVQFLFVYPWLARPRLDTASTLQVARAEFEEAPWESPARAARRHALALSGIWLVRHRHTYRGVRHFLRHEVMRPCTYALAKRFGQRISQEADAPWIL